MFVLKQKDVEEINQFIAKLGRKNNGKNGDLNARIQNFIDNQLLNKMREEKDVDQKAFISAYKQHISTLRSGTNKRSNAHISTSEVNSGEEPALKAQHCLDSSTITSQQTALEALQAQFRQFQSEVVVKHQTEIDAWQERLAKVQSDLLNAYQAEKEAMQEQFAKFKKETANARKAEKIEMQRQFAQFKIKTEAAHQAEFKRYERELTEKINANSHQIKEGEKELPVTQKIKLAAMNKRTPKITEVDRNINLLSEALTKMEQHGNEQEKAAVEQVFCNNINALLRASESMVPRYHAPNGNNPPPPVITSPPMARTNPPPPVITSPPMARTNPPPSVIISPPVIRTNPPPPFIISPPVARTNPPPSAITRPPVAETNFVPELKVTQQVNISTAVTSIHEQPIEEHSLQHNPSMASNISGYEQWGFFDQGAKSTPNDFSSLSYLPAELLDSYNDQFGSYL